MIVDPPPGGRPPADPNPAERAYLRRRAWDEIGRAGAAEDSVARLPHAAMARAYCAKCRAIADPRECADCTLRPLCQTLAASCRAGALFGQASYNAIAPEPSVPAPTRIPGKPCLSTLVRAS